MVCQTNIPFYLPHTKVGLDTVSSTFDGYGVKLLWTQAYSDTIHLSLGYNIYFSSIEEDVFVEDPKLVVLDPKLLQLEIDGGFAPGETYYFAVRAFEYDPILNNLQGLPNTGVAYMYAEGALLSDLGINDASIFTGDIDQFPSYGIVQVGDELIHYTNKDIPNNALTGLTRGFYNSNIRIHDIDGYDGHYIENPLVRYFKGWEEPNVITFEFTNQFAYPNFPVTIADGYKTVKQDNLTLQLQHVDAEYGEVNALDGGTATLSQQLMPPYDYAGWHRTNPVALLRGDCVGTYYGGEQYCADGYSGVGRVLRGLPIQDVNAQRQEILLNLTGSAVVLVRRLWTGIRCSCHMFTNEIPDDRCPNCYGVGFVGGYEQFINPRRSDGRIMISFNPVDDQLKAGESGFESDFQQPAWTLPVPIIKDRDFIIRYHESGVESFRYEITSITRNRLINQTAGGQHMTMKRVRKTDPITNFRVINNTSTMPREIFTTVSSVPGLIVPHMHSLIVDENITNISQINETSSISQFHNHRIESGIMLPTLNHIHLITFP